MGAFFGAGRVGDRRRDYLGNPNCRFGFVGSRSDGFWRCHPDGDDRCVSWLASFADQFFPGAIYRDCDRAHSVRRHAQSSGSVWPVFVCRNVANDPLLGRVLHKLACKKPNDDGALGDVVWLGPASHHGRDAIRLADNQRINSWHQTLEQRGFETQSVQENLLARNASK